MKVEEKYLDVLQNIESGIVSVYRQDTELLDYEVLDAIQALTRYYRAEEEHLNPPRLRLSERGQRVFDSVKTMCEWRLGREKLVNQNKEQLDVGIRPITVSEIIVCLKYIHKSVQRWNKQGGRQGYLRFVTQFIR